MTETESTSDKQAADRASPVQQFYQERSSHLQSSIDEFRRRERNVSRMRIIAFVSIGLVAATGIGIISSPAGYVGAGILGAVFVGLVAYHEWLLEQLAQLSIRLEYNRQRVARRTRNWDGIPAFRARQELQDAPVARDLDLFSGRSLVRLVSEAFTPEGQRQIQDWLFTPADVPEIVERQEAIRYLANDWQLREDIALRVRMLALRRAAPDRLAEWGAGELYLGQRRWMIWLARLLALAMVILVGLLWFETLPRIYWLAVFGLFIVNTLYSALFLGGVHDIFNRVTVGQREIDHYQSLFRTVADLPADVPRLNRLRQTMRGHAADFDRALRHLQRCVALGNGRRSAIWFMPYIVAQLTLLWDFHVLDLLERWQKAYGPVLRDWFVAVGNLEAFASFAGLSYDHPDWCFPQPRQADAAAKVPDDGTITRALPVVSIRAVGHPLLPMEQCVRNDVSVGPAGQLLLVTGSNMSGKSTLLRSIGTNVMLAQAGSVVCAEQMSWLPVRVETSMRISDSLADGVSFFMAELKRLKQVVDQATACRHDANRTLLFLLDEILQGTNSRERHIAVETIVSHLCEAGATGAVSTHDIELANSPLLSKVCWAIHFRESFEQQNGRETMVFDYRLHDGVCPTTNALRLLELVGLS